MSISFTQSSPYPNENCGICLCALNDDVIQHDKHKFHKICLSGWIKNHPYCPLCRVPIDTTSILGFKVLIKQKQGNSIQLKILKNITAFVIIGCTIPTVIDLFNTLDQDRGKLAFKICWDGLLMMASATMLYSLSKEPNQ